MNSILKSVLSMQISFCIGRTDSTGAWGVATNLLSKTYAVQDMLGRSAQLLIKNVIYHLTGVIWTGRMELYYEYCDYIDFHPYMK